MPLCEEAQTNLQRYNTRWMLHWNHRAGSMCPHWKELVKVPMQWKKRVESKSKNAEVCNSAHTYGALTGPDIVCIAPAPVHTRSMLDDITSAKLYIQTQQLAGCCFLCTFLRGCFHMAWHQFLPACLACQGHQPKIEFVQNLVQLTRNSINKHELNTLYTTDYFAIHLQYNCI